MNSLCSKIISQFFCALILTKITPIFHKYRGYQALMYDTMVYFFLLSFYAYKIPGHCTGWRRPVLRGSQTSSSALEVGRAEGRPERFNVVAPAEESAPVLLQAGGSGVCVGGVRGSAPKFFRHDGCPRPRAGDQVGAIHVLAPHARLAAQHQLLLRRRTCGEGGVRKGLGTTRFVWKLRPCKFSHDSGGYPHTHTRPCRSLDSPKSKQKRTAAETASVALDVTHR